MFRYLRVIVLGGASSLRAAAARDSRSACRRALRSAARSLLLAPATLAGEPEGNPEMGDDAGAAPPKAVRGAVDGRALLFVIAGAIAKDWGALCSASEIASASST